MNTNPLINIPIELTLKNTNRFSHIEITNNNDLTSVIIPKNELINLIIKDKCGDEIYNQAIGVFINETTVPVIKLDYNKSFTLQGTLKNCNGELVKDGYIIYKVAQGNPEYFALTNGQLNQRIPYCKLEDYTVIGFDNSNFMITNPFEGILNDPISNFGPLTACDSFGEYISYSVDGKKPSKRITSLIECYDNTDGFEISAKYGLDYFNLSSKTKVSSTHTHSDMNFSAADIHYNQTTGLDIGFKLHYGKSKSDFVDIEINGFYRDIGDNSYHELKAIVHVKRDN